MGDLVRQNVTKQLRHGRARLCGCNAIRKDVDAGLLIGRGITIGSGMLSGSGVGREGNTDAICGTGPEAGLPAKVDIRCSQQAGSNRLSDLHGAGFAVVFDADVDGGSDRSGRIPAPGTTGQQNRGANRGVDVHFRPSS